MIERAPALLALEVARFDEGLIGGAHDGPAEEVGHGLDESRVMGEGTEQGGGARRELDAAGHGFAVGADVVFGVDNLEVVEGPGAFAGLDDGEFGTDLVAEISRDEIADDGVALAVVLRELSGGGDGGGFGGGGHGVGPVKGTG